MRMPLKKIAFLLAALGLTAAACAQKLKGSDTLLPLAQKAAENYSEKNPSAHVTVTGGGSGVGLSSLREGTTDIAMASRRIKFDERVRMQQAGRPVEELTVDCPETCSGTVIELATKRKGTLRNMTSNGDRVRLEFDIPSRGIIGLRSNMLTATAGEAIMTHRLKDFEPWVGEIEMRTNGSIISGETGTAYAYSIDKLQDRGRFFISPMEQVYAGQVIGEHTRQNDITVNVTKAKQLTNMRASGSDDKTSIAPPKVFTLEEALEYIQADEYVEVTPHAMRLRKILLHEVDRKRASK